MRPPCRSLHPVTRTLLLLPALALAADIFDGFSFLGDSIVIFLFSLGLESLPADFPADVDAVQQRKSACLDLVGAAAEDEADGRIPGRRKNRNAFMS